MLNHGSGRYSLIERGVASGFQGDNRYDSSEGGPWVELVTLLSLASGPTSALAKSDRERRRGRYLLVLSLGWIGLAWVVFLGTAWVSLRCDPVDPCGYHEYGHQILTRRRVGPFDRRELIFNVESPGIYNSSHNTKWIRRSFQPSDAQRPPRHQG